MLVFMKARYFGMRCYPHQLALINICIPAIYIRVVVMEFDMSNPPYKAISAYQVENVDEGIIQPLAFEDGMVYRIVYDIKVIYYQ